MNDTASSRPRLLLIGPLPRSDGPVGGTQVSFGGLVGRFRSSATFEIEVLDTSRRDAYRRSAAAATENARTAVRTLAALAARVHRFDAVMFNASSGAILAIGPLVALACRARKVPLAVRVFGGDVDLALERRNPLLRSFVERTALAAPLVLLQTRALCSRFEATSAARWLPTTRDLPAIARRARRECRRFLFLSQLRPEKGCAEALAAIQRAPEGCSLTVAGPPMPGAGIEALLASPRTTYAGEVPQERVPELLAAHDALLFPSYYSGEGMPGVLVEALQAGLPVVATRWRSLPEIVEHGRSGLLVEPRSIDELAGAITRLATDAAEYRRLAAGARERGDQFRAAPVHAQLESWLLELCGRGAPPSRPPVRERRAPPIAHVT